MRLISEAVQFGFVILLLAAGGTASDPPAVSLRGRVVGPDGQAVAGAVVRYRTVGSDENRGAPEATPVSIRSDEDGFFSSGEMTSRRFDLRVHADGYAFWTGRGLDPEQELKVTLAAGRPLTGRVLAAENGEGIVGVRVRLDDTEALDLGGAELETTTDDEGRYRFDHAPPGTVWVRAVGAERAARSIRGRVRAPGRGEGGAALDDLWLPDGGRISGRIVDAARKPVSGAEVVIVPVDFVGTYRDSFPAMKARSDGAGRFEFDGVTAGTRYRVMAREDRYCPGAAGPFTVAAGSVIDDVTVTLRGGATLRLRLVDAEDRPATDVTMHLESEEDQPSHPSANYRVVKSEEDEIEIGEEGWLTVRRLVPSRYTVRLEPVGWVDLRLEEVILKDGETTDLGSLRLEPGSELAGRVVDGGNDPVAGAAIEANWRDLRGRYTRRAKSGLDGGFRIGGLPDFKLKLAVSAEGYADGEVEEVAPGGEALVITLDRAGGIRGKVVLTGGGVSGSFSVQALPRGDSQGAWHEFDALTGEFEIDDLDPGVHSVEVRSPGLAPGRVETIKVAAGRVADAGEIRLAPGLVFQGRVVRDAGGAPVPGARVRIDRGAGPARWAEPAADAAAISDLHGRFSFDGLEPGRYLLNLDHAEFAPVQRSLELDPEAPTEEVEIRLGGGGEVHVSVEDADGLPVAGANVYIQRGIRGFDRRMAATRSNGTFRFERLAPGSYMIFRTRSRARSGFNTGMRTIEVREGEVTTVVFSDRSEP